MPEPKQEPSIEPETIPGPAVETPAPLRGGHEAGIAMPVIKPEATEPAQQLLALKDATASDVLRPVLDQGGEASPPEDTRKSLMTRMRLPLCATPLPLRSRKQCLWRFLQPPLRVAVIEHALIAVRGTLLGRWSASIIKPSSQKQCKRVKTARWFAEDAASRSSGKPRDQLTSDIGGMLRDRTTSRGSQSPDSEALDKVKQQLKLAQKQGYSSIVDRFDTDVDFTMYSDSPKVGRFASKYPAPPTTWTHKLSTLQIFQLCVLPSLQSSNFCFEEANTPKKGKEG